MAIFLYHREVSTMEVLPPDISRGATLRGNEYGWNIPSFPEALASAETLGYACLGGQFQFRLDDVRDVLAQCRFQGKDRQGTLGGILSSILFGGSEQVSGLGIQNRFRQRGIELADSDRPD